MRELNTVGRDVDIDHMLFDSGAGDGGYFVVVSGTGDGCDIRPVGDCEIDDYGGGVSVRLIDESLAVLLNA